MKRYLPARYFLIITIVLGLVFTMGLAPVAGRSVRVGIYYNPPLQSLDEEGGAEGFMVDILDYIAEKENWSLEFAPCIWSQCLTQLAEGKIDLLGAIAYSPERAQRFDFNQETVISNWGVIFAQPGQTNIDITDLDGWRIAAIENDIHTTALKDLLKRFDILAHFLYVSDYRAAMEAVEANTADAALVNHLFAMENQGKYSASETSILFNPIKVHFATGKGTHADLLTALDKHIHELKVDPNSLYYQSLHKWFGGAPSPQIPRWIVWTLVVILGLAVMLLGGNLFLRHEIRRRTADLQASETRFRTLIEQAGDAVFLCDFEGNFLEVNQQACNSLGYSREELLALTITDVNARFSSPKAIQDMWRKLRPGEPVTITGEHRRKDGSTFPVEIRVGLIKFGGQKTILEMARDVSFRQEAEAERERLLRRQNAVNRLALALGEYRDLSSLYHLIYEQVTALMDAPAFIITLFDSTTQLIHVAFMAIDGSALDVSQFPVIPLQAEGKGRQSQVIRTGEPLYLPDYREVLQRNIGTIYSVEEDGSIVPGPPSAEELDDSTKSAIFAPMKIRGKVIGVMQVQSKQLDAYTQEDVESLTALANMAAIAVNSASLIESLRERSEQLEALRQASLSLTSNLSLGPVFDEVLKHALKLVQAEDAHVFLYDGQKLSFGAARWSSGRTGTPFANPRENGLTYQVARSGKRMIVPDFQKSPLYQDWPLSGAIVGLPLRRGEEVVGVMNVATAQPHEFTENELHVLELLADQAAVAIVNARLHEQIQRYAAELEHRVQERTAELQQFVNLMAGREIRMTELKEVIRQLRAQLEEAGLEPVANDPLFSET